MKKKLAIILVVLVILYPGTVWLMGILTEQRVQEALALLPQQLPYLLVSEQHYRRGWYRSEQDLTLQLALGKLLPVLAASAPTPVSIRIHSVIHHGPLCGLSCFGFARIDASYVPGSAVAPAISRLYGTRSPVSVRVHLGFLGGEYVRFSTPPLKDVELPKERHLSWGGAVIEARVSGNLDHRSVRATIPDIAIRNADGNALELSQLALDGSSRRVLGPLYSSQLALTAKQLSYRVAGPMDFSVQDIRLDAQTPVHQGYMDVIEQISTGTVHSAGADLREAHLDFSIRHAQVKAMAAIQERVQALNQSQGLSLRPATGALLTAIREPLQQLLLDKPELRLDAIKIITPHGQILIHGSVRTSGLTAADLSQGMNMLLLMQRIDVSLDVSADDSALADLPGLAGAARQQLPAFEQQGLVSHANGEWRTIIHFGQGRTTVNGKPFGASPFGASPFGGNRPAPAQ
ncbi:MAG TPA: YdgA family protein [Steroidobacteraceae bacterium]|nr:YdgA family protein [Steroidobacteraceae bacterium]